MPRKATDRRDSGPTDQQGARRAPARGAAAAGGNRAAVRRLTGDAHEVTGITRGADLEPEHTSHRVVSHDLLRTPASRSALPQIGHDSSPGHLRRHASWEHKMLGDVDPDVLEIISSGKDVAAEEKKKSGWLASTRASAKTIKDDKGGTIDLETVQHTIDQEIRRLQLFKSAPPQGSVADATKALQEADARVRKDEATAAAGLPTRGSRSPEQAEEAAKVEKTIDDAKWDVRLVELALSDGSSFLVTYGEMNTLADFYGSPQELAQTPAANFKGILGGVREESLRKFMRLRNELTISGDKKYDPDSDENKFAGAIGNKGESYTGIGGDAFGELKLMGKMPGWGNSEARAKVDNKEETSYVAGLVRNACHFAPQSWHSWAGAHNKAIGLAQEAHQQNAEVKRLEAQIVELQAHITPESSEGLKKAIGESIANVQKAMEAAKKLGAAKLNQALIENGFGDHFLQDSYAAGHLINKSLIMQWFAQWLDTKGRKRDYSTEEQWRSIQQIAYGQKAVAGKDLYDKSTVGEKQSNDPQSVENIGGDDWTVRFKALGLAIPSSLTRTGSNEFALFTWWQEQAMDGKLLKADASDLVKDGPVKDPAALQIVLKKLIDDGVVYYNWYSAKDRAKGAEKIGVGNKSLRLKTEYIPKKENEEKFKSSVAKAKTGDTADYDKMAEAVTYADYHKFLNHGYLQLSSNVLHDDFCKNGLDVATAAGDTPFKIYGDNAMLDKESAKGVKYSATTSKMSRDSIYELAASGQTANSTQLIAARFPTYVRPKGGPQMSLDAWHGDGGALYKYCFDTVFDKAAAIFSKGTIAAKGVLAKKASKDDKVDIHSGEAF